MFAACLLIALVGSAALRTVAKPLLLSAYETRFSFVPGHWFGQRVADLARQSSEACIIIGASNAREGFEPIVLGQAVSGTRFVNAATTGGNNEVLEVQSAILERYGIRPKCAVVGASSWTMFRDGSPSITSEEYLGLLEWTDVLNISSRPLLTREGPWIAAGLLLPLKAQARQLNRLVRWNIHNLRNATISKLPISNMESFPDELKPADDYLYLDTPPHLFADWEKLVDASAPWYPASRYGGALQDQSFRKTLDRLISLSERVVVVVTPQTEILSPAVASGSPYFWALMKEYAGRIDIIDCSTLDAPKLFVDEGHLTAEGRNIMSGEVGAILAESLSGAKSAPPTHCRPVFL